MSGQLKLLMNLFDAVLITSIVFKYIVDLLMVNVE